MNRFFYNSNKIQGAAIRQLITLKESIDNREIREKLSARGLVNAINENSYFDELRTLMVEKFEIITVKA